MLLVSYLFNRQCQAVVASKGYLLHQHVVQGVDPLRLGPVCSDALHLASTTELAVSASAEEIELTALGDDTSVSTAANHLLYLLVEVELPWLVQVLTICMAQLTIIAIAPGKDLTLIRQDGTMLLTC